jgi:DNA-directed RNA polymerase specialized sigma24 family protein
MLPPLAKNRNLTQDLFDDLLNWLNADRDLAGMAYEDMRRRLIKLFVCRHCHDPESLADETINRVTMKIKQLKDTFVGPREPYFYAVANKVYLEYLRAKPTIPVPPDLSATTMSDRIEAEYGCLEHCLERQSLANRKLVLEYYKGERRTKIEYRKRLAEEYGIALNALRIRVHRIRALLEECVKSCINTSAGNGIDS